MPPSLPEQKPTAWLTLANVKPGTGQPAERAQRCLKSRLTPEEKSFSSHCRETLEMFLLQGRGHLPTVSNSHLHQIFPPMISYFSHALYQMRDNFYSAGKKKKKLGQVNRENKNTMEKSNSSLPQHCPSAHPLAVTTAIQRKSTKLRGNVEYLPCTQISCPTSLRPISEEL